MSSEDVSLFWLPWNEEASTHVEKLTKYHASKQPHRNKVSKHAFVEEGGYVWLEPRKAWRCLQVVTPCKHHFPSVGECWSITQNAMSAFSHALLNETKSKEDPPNKKQRRK